MRRKTKPKVLVTGGTGFIGRALIKTLSASGRRIVAPIRSEDSSRGLRIGKWKCPVIGEINSNTDWGRLLHDVDAVVHCANQSGVIDEKKPPQKQPYFEINVNGTLNLAKQASEAKVRRFIFLSSIKVNGQYTEKGKTFNELDPPNFSDLYGESKYETESRLLELTKTTAMETVIIRSPLVYGPNSKGNFEKLSKLVSSGIPLPLSSIRNSRSFLAIDNLCDLIQLCLDHEAAANEIFMASDGQDLSTPELLHGIAAAMGVSLTLYPCPPRILEIIANAFGTQFLAQRILGSLCVNAGKAEEKLQWTPPVNVQEGLKRCFPEVGPK